MKIAKLKLPLKHIVVHCSATKAGQDIGAKEIDSWHRTRGFLKIGYHFVIRLDGKFEVGRYEDEVGAHAEGFNSSSIAVCLVGGLDANGKPENNFNHEQMETLRRIVFALKDLHPNAEVLGHRDLPGVKKDCPCFDVRAWWKTAQK